ncbi:MAG: dihydrolipoyl dehydrogenase family protein, partial [Stellaceae bacterium]
HLDAAIAAIAPHDSQEHFERLGCRVIRARARFLDARTVAAGGERIRARRFVIATGSRVAEPPIPGLDTVPFLTNDTIFALADLPRHLLVLGGGPVGCELAQAFRRLGAAVTLIDAAEILPHDDRDAVAVVRRALSQEGIALLERATIERVARAAGSIAVSLDDGRQIEGSHLLLATGRRANVDDLGLETASIAHGPDGIEVDARLRTTNARVYAAGDVVAGSPGFTHVAGYHAGVVLRNTLLRLPAKIDLRALPWVTFTDPELAQVGMTAAAARARRGAGIRIVETGFDANDRAEAEGEPDGFAKIIATRHGHILGATIVGPHAGELVHAICLAMAARLPARALVRPILPYPTRGEITRQTACAFVTPILFGPWTRRLVRALAVLG